MAHSTHDCVLLGVQKTKKASVEAAEEAEEAPKPKKQKKAAEGAEVDATEGKKVRCCLWDMMGGAEAGGGGWGMQGRAGTHWGTDVQGVPRS